MLPAIRGVIDRRLLVNYRVDPAALADRLPDRFEPQTVDGWAVGGICLIRLRDVRPRFLPRLFGVGSENAAHRIAVTVDGDTAVYVPRRDTNSWFNTAAGGRAFPGVHSRATFDVEEGDGHYDVSMESLDGETHVHVAGEPTEALPSDSVFDSVAAASAFFERGSTGYSPGRRDGEYEALELDTFEWAVEPLAVESVASSYFDALPDEAVTFDHALLMADIRHEWREGESLCSSPTAE